LRIGAFRHRVQSDGWSSLRPYFFRSLSSAVMLPLCC
jgi:hypothetical protein